MIRELRRDRKWNQKVWFHHRSLTSYVWCGNLWLHVPYMILCVSPRVKNSVCKSVSFVDCKCNTYLHLQSLILIVHFFCKIWMLIFIKLWTQVLRQVTTYRAKHGTLNSGLVFFSFLFQRLWLCYNKYILCQSNRLKLFSHPLHMVLRQVRIISGLYSYLPSSLLLVLVIFYTQQVGCAHE